MTIVVADKKLALYFGCLDGLGHYFHVAGSRHTSTEMVPGFPWNIGHLDSGLLKNGKRRDVYDGKVFWTCGGTPLWIALYWWDRSVDRRGASNSGFYVQGFGHTQAVEALAFAGSVFPDVITRQHQPLVLQP